MFESYGVIRQGRDNKLCPGNNDLLPLIHPLNGPCSSTFASTFGIRRNPMYDLFKRLTTFFFREEVLNSLDIVETENRFSLVLLDLVANTDHVFNRQDRKSTFNFNNFIVYLD